MASPVATSVTSSGAWPAEGFACATTLGAALAAGASAKKIRRGRKRRICREMISGRDAQRECGTVEERVEQDAWIDASRAAPEVREARSEGGDDREADEQSVHEPEGKPDDDDRKAPSVGFEQAVAQAAERELLDQGPDDGDDECERCELGNPMGIPRGGGQALLLVRVAERRKQRRDSHHRDEYSEGDPDRPPPGAGPPQRERLAERRAAADEQDDAEDDRVLDEPADRRAPLVGDLRVVLGPGGEARCVVERGEGGGEGEPGDEAFVHGSFLSGAADLECDCASKPPTATTTTGRPRRRGAGS